MTRFSWVDGGIVGFYLLATMVAGLAVRKYVARVEHFLVAGREMSVCLGIASLAATEFGIITCMYTAQNGYEKGFAGAIPGICQAVTMLVIGLTGFCIKPLRESGVMTIPEMFERRFGSRIRCAAGVVIVLGGLLNMGVFLRTGGEFLVLVCEFDVKYLEIAMTVLLVGVAAYTILGGMLSVLVTDFLRFVVMSVGLIAVTVLILVNVGWDRLVGAVEIHNDILAPFRKKPWSERKSLLINRAIVALIGVFLLFYGLWYPLKGDLWTYLGVTGTICLSSMTTLLIACCYWKRANNWGAAAAIVCGAVVPISYRVLEQIPATRPLTQRIGPYYSGIATYLLVGAAMVIGSLLKPQTQFQN